MERIRPQLLILLCTFAFTLTASEDWIGCPAVDKRCDSGKGTQWSRGYPGELTYTVKDSFSKPGFVLIKEYSTKNNEITDSSILFEIPLNYIPEKQETKETKLIKWSSIWDIFD
jgi:hypothetical protein